MQAEHLLLRCLRGQRRAYQQIKVVKSGSGPKRFTGYDWEKNTININPAERGFSNDTGLEHFWCSRAMTRIPPDKMHIPLPLPPFTFRKWDEFYHELKHQHPVPVTEWLETGWTTTTRNDPYLEAFHNIHYNENLHWRPYEYGYGNSNQKTHRYARKETRVRLYQLKAAIWKKYSQVPASDNVLEWIQKMAGGKKIVEVQARGGYWSWQLQQAGAAVAATYEEWLEVIKRRVEPQCQVAERSGAEEFASGAHDDHVVLTVSSERVLEELEGWKGDTVCIPSRSVFPLMFRIASDFFLSDLPVGIL